MSRWRHFFTYHLASCSKLEPTKHKVSQKKSFGTEILHPNVIYQRVLEGFISVLLLPFFILLARAPEGFREVLFFIILLADLLDKVNTCLTSLLNLPASCSVIDSLKGCYSFSYCVCVCGKGMKRGQRPCKPPSGGPPTFAIPMMVNF